MLASRSSEEEISETLGYAQECSSQHLCADTGNDSSDLPAIEPTDGVQGMTDSALEADMPIESGQDSDQHSTQSISEENLSWFGWTLETGI